MLPIIYAISFIVCLCNTQSLHAQENLKAFEGVYRFQQNKDAFLKITVKENHLMLKQLWDGKEFPFEQKSPLEFYSEEQSFPLKFKDSAGTIVQVLAFNRDVWDRVRNYKPELKKEIQLSSKELKAFEGKYKMNDGNEDAFLQITSNGKNLILKQLWDGQEIFFVPESPLDFFCKDRLFPLKFTKGEDGAVTQVLAFNKDVWVKVKE